MVRPAVALLAALALASVAGAAPAFVQSDGSFSLTTAAASQTDTLTHTSTSGNTLIAFFAWKTTTRTMNYVCGGTSCTATTSTGKWFPYTWAFCSASTCNQIWICRNCAATSTITANWTGTTVADTQVEEYSGVVAIGQVATATATSTHPAVSITIQDNNNIVVMATSSLGNDGVPTSSTGNLRNASRSGTTSSFDAGASCDNTSSTAGTSVTCQVTITSSVWAAQAVELRSATTSDSANFVSAYMGGTPAEAVSMPSITGPLVPDPFLSGNTAVCWAFWPYLVTQTETVTTRSTFGGSTVDTLTQDVEKDDTTSGPFQSIGIWRGAPTTGVQYLNFAFGTAIGASGTVVANFQYGCAQFKGITTSSPVRTTGGATAQSGGTISSAALTGLTAGDIVVVVVTPDNSMGAGGVNTQNQGTGYCAPGPGFVLLAVSNPVGVCAEYTVATGTSVTPTLYMPNTAGYTGTFNIAAVAYIPNGSQGTAATGMHIVRQQTPVISGGFTNGVYINCPSDGNFNSFYLTNSLSGTTESSIFKIWDTNQVAYSLNDPSGSAGHSPFLMYSTASTLDNSAGCQLWQNSSNGSNSEMLLRDIAGVATSSVFDSVTCPSTSTFGATGCESADLTFAATYPQAPNITPSASGELVLGGFSNGVGPTSAGVAPSGAINDCPYFTNMTDSSPTCYGEGHMHLYTTGTSNLNVTYTAGANASGNGVGSAIAIKAAPALGAPYLNLMGVGK